MNDLFPLLSKNGILAIDESQKRSWIADGGEGKAIKEFSNNHNLELLYHSPLPGPSYYIKNN